MTIYYMKSIQFFFLLFFFIKSIKLFSRILNDILYSNISHSFVLIEFNNKYKQLLTQNISHFIKIPFLEKYFVFIRRFLQYE